MKIFLNSIGCRLNQSEIDNYATQLSHLGHQVQATPANADLAIINTCAVTFAAASDSRQKIRNVNKAGINNIVVTGCLSTLNSNEISLLEGVTKIIPNNQKDSLTSILFPQQPEIFDIEPLNRNSIHGARFHTRGFIKVQDGCDNHCTFCITKLARGKSSSLSIQDIHANIERYYLNKSNFSNNANELVLTGVHLGSWGQDFDPPRHLKDLIQSILDHFDVPRLRLSSLEPWDLNSEFFKLWADPRLCRHLHLPLQSGSSSTLRRMARKTTPQSFSSLVTQAREAIPEVAITTDLITGFPGETDAEFDETLQFVREQNFAGGHVFTYSPRSGTAAMRLPDQIPFPIRKERNAQLRDVLEKAAHAYQSHYIGQILNVLWESTTQIGPDGWHLTGLTDNYIRVSTTTPQLIWNQITPVRISSQTEKGLEGQIVTD